MQAVLDSSCSTQLFGTKESYNTYPIYTMMQELNARDLRIFSKKVRRAHVDDSREETSYVLS